MPDLATGTATVHIPIPLPRARGAAQPDLTLSYSSSSGNGVIGLGWSTGVPFIARDPGHGGLSYDDRADYHPAQDRFLFNGSELVPLGRVSGGRTPTAPSDEVFPPWAEGWQYFRSWVESGQFRFFWSPDHRTWRVQAGQTGIALELGVPLDGSNDDNAIEYATEGDTSRIFRWNAARAYDAYGIGKPLEAAQPQPYNPVVYRYIHDGGQAYLSDIFDTPPANNSASAPLSQFAHHTRLIWQPRPDITSNYRRGFRVEQRLRLARVDVASKTYDGATDSPRRQVRRAYLSYDSQSHASLLTAVAFEGRCAGSELDPRVPAEDTNSHLPEVTSCGTRNPTRIAYTHVAAAEPITTATGFEPFDATIHSVAGSPPVALDASLGVTIFDFNGDGLPDVLDGDSARYGGTHRAYISGVGGLKNTFGPPTPVAIDTVVASDGSKAGGFDLSLRHSGVAPLDFNGDGVVDLVFMPRFGRPFVFSPRHDATATTLRWQGSAPTPIDRSTADLELVRGNPNTRVFDANGDGLVDFVTTTGSEILTYLALGRFPGGDGKFGHATPTGPGTADLSAEPLHACLPAANGLVSFSDPRVHIADMNGDGLADIVRVKNGRIEYWPGRGSARWGTGNVDACAPPNDAAAIEMSTAPFFGVSDEDVRIGDLNGDAFADVVAVGGTAITVWLNVDGASWTKAISIPRDRTASTAKSVVQIADLNGSGTEDIVFGDAGNYRYIDLLGGARPSLLARIDHDSGKSTLIDYVSSTDEMLAASAGGTPWSSTVPIALPVVKRVTVADNLERIGRAAGRFVTEYGYRDALFDRHNHAFRVFGHVTTHSVGGADAIGQSVHTYFHAGGCADEGVAQRCDSTSADSNREALFGLVRAVDVVDDAGTYLSTTHTTYRLRSLYTSLDGREVRSAFGSAIDEYRYETTGFSSNEQDVSAVDVELEQAGSVVNEPGTLRLHSSARVHLRTEMSVDRYGHVLERRSLGCVEGCAAPDETIASHHRFERAPGDASGWLFVEAEGYVDGSAHPDPRQHLVIDHDVYGAPVKVTGALTGTLPLVRSHETGASVAPPPADASKDGPVVIVSRTFDGFGNLQSEVSASHRCGRQGFDTVYAELPVLQITYAGDVGADGCGTTPLFTTATFDRGMRAVQSTVGTNGEASRVDLDEFGRLLRAFDSSATTLGAVDPLPSKQFDYVDPTDASPVQTVRERTLVGTSASDASYAERWTFSDGVGRTIATFTQADPANGDGGQWVVSGVGDYDSRGRAIRAYQPSFWTGQPRPVVAVGAIPFERVAYDAFGRTLERYGTDGALAARIVYHALYEDLWDAADVAPSSAHYGTYATTVHDGHGRDVAAIERVRLTGVLNEIETRVSYLPTGEQEKITRAVRGSSDPPIVRWMKHDSLGRLVLNVEPNTSAAFNPDPNTSPDAIRAWRYAYNDAGQVVGTSDARGCGVNVAYDAAGRVVAKDVSPCLASQAPYTAPDLRTGDGTEEFYRYDTVDPDIAPAPTPSDGGAPGADAGSPPSTVACAPLLDNYRGRLVSVATRGAKLLSVVDARGRAVCEMRRIAKPNDVDPVLATRYAPRWWSRQFTYDLANRIASQTTGVQSSELFGAGGDSRLTAVYSARGQLSAVGGSYGPIVSARTFDALGSIASVTWGDIAGTRTAYAYDARHRLATVQTTRGRPTLWSGPSGLYTPPSPGAEPTLQTVLEDSETVYDEADNPIELRDRRDPAAWPTGAKPVSRTIDYDDLYRVVRVRYANGGDTWASPFRAELAQIAQGKTPKLSPAPAVSFGTRTQEESFSYDWRGNLVQSDDDSHGFYDRSLGAQAHAATAPYQLTSATNASLGGTNTGRLSTRFDAAGNLVDLVVLRDGPCLPATASCSQRFSYDWDEEGYLARARRWDLANSERAALADTNAPLPTRRADVELRYQYGSDGERVVKTAVDANGAEIHDARIFSTVELRHARFDAVAGDYEVTSRTESLRLSIDGLYFGRVAYAENDVPTATSGQRHVFLELADSLGSNTTVLDRDTSELVERTAYSAYGSTESDYRPDRWDNFREPYRFTGKEDDVEVGLVYVGKRYYSPALNRWISPDPVAVHQAGSDPNVYAYAKGRAFAGVDPDGRFIFVACVIGFVISAAIDAAVQYSTNPDHNINMGQVFLAGAAGAIGGGVGSAAGWGLRGLLLARGLSLGTAEFVSAVGGGMAGSLAGGVSHRGLVLLPDFGSGRISGQQYASTVFDPRSMAVDTALGAGSGVLSYGVNKAIAPFLRAPTPELQAPEITPSPLTKAQIAEVGESRALDGLRDMGAGDAMPVQNSSGHGIDGIGSTPPSASAPNGEVLAAEAKATGGAQPPRLSDAQQDMEKFVKSRLERMMADENVPLEQRAHAERMWKMLKSGAELKGTVYETRYTGTPNEFTTTRPWTNATPAGGQRLAPPPIEVPAPRTPNLVIISCYTARDRQVWCMTGRTSF